jgi:hypothetical protein
VFAVASTKEMFILVNMSGHCGVCEKFTFSEKITASIIREDI